MKKWLWILPGLLSVSSARAYDATLKAFQGKAFVRSAGETAYRPLRPGQKFRRDDTLRTGDGGLVQVAFKSGATVLVKENSRFSLRSDKNGDALTFVRGEFLIGLRNRLKGRDKFTVRTPACVAAVRGTVFWGLSDDKKKSTYACFTGAIEVTARGRSVTLNPGQKLAVAFGAAPSKTVPANIPKEYIKTFAVDDSLQGAGPVVGLLGRSGFDGHAG
ncbi:MAG TPA: FecR domain-containing protein, partial [Elusimicrobiota bacterium]|nr:FecR domain-containing protein [Elusimicrobiota bacterium]